MYEYIIHDAYMYLPAKSLTNVIKFNDTKRIVYYEPQIYTKQGSNINGTFIFHRPHILFSNPCLYRILFGLIFNCNSIFILHILLFDCNVLAK